VVILTGTHPYSGTTALSGALLEVDGSLTSSTVDVTGGTLAGNGSVGGLSAAAGTIAPGTTANPFAPLAVSADANLQAGATLALHADPASTSSSMLAIAENVSLGGTVSVDFGGGTPALGNVYVLLSAGSISGTFSSLALPDGVFGQLVYSSGSVQLEITDSAADEIFGDGFEGPTDRIHGVVYR